MGVGLSVKELVDEFSRVCGRPIPCEQQGRRIGDVDSLICNGDLAKKELNWCPIRDITTMCKCNFLLSFLQTYNLGTGKGISVLQLLKMFEVVTKTSIPYNIENRREGDIVSMVANASLAFKELGWEAKYGLQEMCKLHMLKVFWSTAILIQIKQYYFICICLIY